MRYDYFPLLRLLFIWILLGARNYLNVAGMGQRSVFGIRWCCIRRLASGLDRDQAFGVHTTCYANGAVGDWLLSLLDHGQLDNSFLVSWQSLARLLGSYGFGCDDFFPRTFRKIIIVGVDGFDSGGPRRLDLQSTRVHSWMLFQRRSSWLLWRYDNRWFVLNWRPGTGALDISKRLFLLGGLALRAEPIHLAAPLVWCLELAGCVILLLQLYEFLIFSFHILAKCVNLEVGLVLWELRLPTAHAISLALGLALFVCDLWPLHCRVFQRLWMIALGFLLNTLKISSLLLTLLLWWASDCYLGQWVVDVAFLWPLPTHHSACIIHNLVEFCWVQITRILRGQRRMSRVVLKWCRCVLDCLTLYLIATSNIHSQQFLLITLIVVLLDEWQFSWINLRVLCIFENGVIQAFVAGRHGVALAQLLFSSAHDVLWWVALVDIVEDDGYALHVFFFVQFDILRPYLHQAVIFLIILLWDHRNGALLRVLRVEKYLVQVLVRLVILFFDVH